MSNVDERVVKVTFDNAQFEQGTATTLATLQKLKTGLQLEGASKGLEEVDTAAKSISLEGVANGVENVAGKFKALSVIGITALANIASKAIDTGISVLKSLTIDPIKAGFENYETQIKATTTILANTAAAGTKIGDVNKVLAQLNTYANQTVYNFSEMTKNIGTFTAAGVKLKPAVEAIKGIANLGALSGSTSDQVSTAMYQISQALAAGVVHLQDWNSVVNAGLGGKTFQTALENTARASGVAIDSIIKKQGGFRNSLQKGWLTSDILTKTLSQFTGDLSLKQIKAMGYTTKQAEGILKLGKIAVNAATQIKTASQLGDALKEEVATAYAAIFKTIFGNISQATTLFTAIHNVAENALTKPIYALNTLLLGVEALGGRAALIDAFKLAFQELGDVIKPIQQAFREIFPPVTAAQIFKLIAAFHVFIENLQISKTGADELKRTFAGVFAVISLGIEIVKDIVKVLVNLFESSTKGSSGILKFTASIGDWLVNLKKAIDNGQDLTKFFTGLNKYLQEPITLIRELGDYIGSLFDKFDGAKAEKAVDGVTAKLGPFGKLANVISDAWGKLWTELGPIADKFKPIANEIGGFFDKLGEKINKGVQGINFQSILNAINTGLFAGLLLLLKKFSSSFLGSGLAGGSGLVHTITETFEGLTKTLKTMQGTLKAATLLEIAAAVAILTAAVSKLAVINAVGLERSLSAIGGMFLELLGAMAILQKIAGSAGFVKIPLIAGSMILMAGAVYILADAVKKLSGLSWSQIEKGLSGLGGILAGLIATMQLMPPSAGMISSGLAMIALAKAVGILVKSVTLLSGLSWSEMEKGLTGVAGLLLSLGLFTKFSDAEKGGALQGAGIILLAEGLKILAGVIQTMGKMSWSVIGKGLATIAGGLTLIGAALYLIPPTAPLSAAGVLITASALGIIGDAVRKMGGFSWITIAKGLTTMAGAMTVISAALILIPPDAALSAAGVYIVALALGMIGKALNQYGAMSWLAIGKSMVVLAGSLAIITLAMIGMTEALPGAAALIVVAGALAILQPVLQAFGQMGWVEIAKSMVVLAGVFVIFGVAGLVLAPLVPVLLGLGAAVLLVGIGMLAAGAGVLAFSVGLTALSISGAAGAAAIVGIVSALIGLIPTVMKEIGLGIVAFAKVISTAGPAITQAIVTVIEALIKAIATLAPKVVDELLKLLLMMLNELDKYQPKLTSAGATLIIELLNGIKAYTPRIATAASNLIVTFINAIASNLGKVIQAGVKLVIAFINGVASAIRSDAPALGAAGGNLGAAIIQGMVEGMASGIGKIVSAAENIGKSAISAAMHALDSHSPSKEFVKIGETVTTGFVKGLTGTKAQIDAAFKTLTNQLITGINDSAKTVDTLENKLKKLTSARKKDRQEIAETSSALTQAKKELKAEDAAYTEVTKTLNNQHTVLGKLATQYASLTDKIKTAQQTLTDAQKTLADFNTQIITQFDTLPEIDATTTVATYTAALSQQVEDTKEFANTLQKLRKAGLSDDAYKQLLAGGVADLPFANQILAGGQATIDQVNSLDKQLDTAAAALGQTASTALYQAAVNSAAGLVKGLENQQAAIEKEMEKIADAMVKAIQKKLKIKSPSQVLAEVGEFTGKGLVNGMVSMQPAIERTATGMGQTVISSLNKTLTGMSDLVVGSIDVKPTITPVLDLSGIKKSASQIGGILSTQPLSVSASYAKAVSANAGFMDNRVSASTPAANPTPKTPTIYNQYNTSPVALSPTTIYRQTKSLLAVAKGDVTP